jgi:hypothetical protein
LITREKGLIKITYNHPRASDTLAKSGHMVPKVVARGGIGAGINACAGSDGITILYGESDREGIKINDSGDMVSG